MLAPGRRAGARSTTRSPRSRPARAEPSSVEGPLRLMLGLERVLARTRAAHSPSGTRLRRHQIDALAGMLTELIAATQREPSENGNGAAAGARSSSRRGGRGRRRSSTARRRGRLEDGRSRAGQDPGARPPLPLPPPDRVRQDDRRRRLRRGRAHARRPDPHAPPPARHAVRPRPDDRGLRRPLHRRDRARQGAAPRANPLTIQTYAWFARHVGDAQPRRVPARDLRRGAHGARREDVAPRSARSRSRSTSA